MLPAAVGEGAAMECSWVRPSETVLPCATAGEPRNAQGRPNETIPSKSKKPLKIIDVK